MRRTLIATTALLLLVAGCSSANTVAETDTGASTSTGEDAGVLAGHGLDGKDAVQIIDELDRLPVAQRPSDLMASVQADELVVSADDGEVTLDIPDDRFYVSVAPYATDTHDCYYHSLTTCMGELGGEDVDVTVTDDSGEVLVDEQMATFDNGFVGMWLPRGTTGTIEMEYDGKSGVVDFGTGKDDPTCVTTLKLT